MKKTLTVFSGKAKQDIVEIALYIASGNVRAAQEFREALERTYAALEIMPQIGSVRSFGDSRLAYVRMLPIQKFEKYLLLYCFTGDTIEVIRVIHCARDLPYVLGESNEDE